MDTIMIEIVFWLVMVIAIVVFAGLVYRDRKKGLHLSWLDYLFYVLPVIGFPFMKQVTPTSPAFILTFFIEVVTILAIICITWWIQNQKDPQKNSR